MGRGQLVTGKGPSCPATPEGRGRRRCGPGCFRQRQCSRYAASANTATAGTGKVTAAAAPSPTGAQTGLPDPSAPHSRRFRVVAYDFGTKLNILRLLADQGCDVTVVPAQTPAADVLAMQPDGVFFSNGPGDPEPCTYAIDALRTFIDRKVPFFGICLGHQLLGLAAGGRTVKMKFGHHGANHPVKDLDTGRVCITSQNHGFAVDAASLPANVRTTTSRCSMARCRASRSPTRRPSASRATPRPRPVRTTWPTCLNVLPS